MKSTDLNKVSCDPMCGFSVQSHDEKELISFVMEHVKNAHGKKMSEAEVRGMMKKV